MSEVLTISPSKVVWLATRESDPFREDNAASIMGKREHRKHLGMALRKWGRVLPGFEEQGGLIDQSDASMLTVEYSCRWAIGESVLATTVVDAVVDDDICIELKPTLKGRHVLQLMLTSMIYAGAHEKDEVWGLLYLYKAWQSKSYALPYGGREYWDEGLRVLLLAAQIIDWQEALDEKKRIIKYGEDNFQQGMRVMEQNIRWRADSVVPQQMVDYRREFDETILGIVNPLVHGLGKLG